MLNHRSSKHVFMIPAFVTDDECLAWLRGTYSNVSDMIDWISWCGPNGNYKYVVLDPPVAIVVAMNNDEDAIMFKLKWNEYID